MDKKQTQDQQKIDILALSRLSVLDENGKGVLISNFWKEQPVIFIFVRHFSCIACRAHVDDIWNKREALKKSKTKIVFIGNGEPHLIKFFREDMNVHDAPIYTDPSLQTFDACGLTRSVLSLLDPRGALKALKLKGQGYNQGSWDNDSGAHTQMGGVVALKPPGIVLYHFISDYLGDYDNPNDWPGAFLSNSSS